MLFLIHPNYTDRHRITIKKVFHRFKTDTIFNGNTLGGKFRKNNNWNKLIILKMLNLFIP